MISFLITCICLFNACVLVGMLAFLLKFKAGMPDIQQILNDVGASIGEQLTGVFEKPVVKRAYTQMQSKSVDARASNALKNRVAEKALGQNVILKKALEYLDITPMEGLELMNDPTVGPVIRNLMAGFAKGGQGLLSGLGGGGQQQQRNSGRGVPVMS